MTLTNWIIGPQSIGVLFLLIGIITYAFPPKKINAWYGFRTPSSQKNQQNWDVANKYATAYMIKAGIILIAGGILLALLADVMPWSEKTKELFRIMLFLGAGVFTAAFLIVATEKHLDKTFKE